MPDISKQSPGNGFLGWLGRQVGHVARAVQTDVTPLDSAPAVVYRTDQVQTVSHPTQPGVMLRRTIVDEIVVNPAHKPPID